LGRKIGPLSEPGVSKYFDFSPLGVFKRGAQDWTFETPLGKVGGFRQRDNLEGILRHTFLRHPILRGPYSVGGRGFLIGGNIGV